MKKLIRNSRHTGIHPIEDASKECLSRFRTTNECTIALDPKDISFLDVRVHASLKALNPHASKRVGKYHAHISRSFPRWIFLPKNENQSSQPYSRRAFGRLVFRFSLWIYSQSRPRNGNLNANILSKGKKKVYYYRRFVGKLFGYWFRMNVSFFFSLSSAVEWYVNSVIDSR